MSPKRIKLHRLYASHWPTTTPHVWYVNSGATYNNYLVDCYEWDLENKSWRLVQVGMNSWTMENGRRTCAMELALAGLDPLEMEKKGVKC